MLVSSPHSSFSLFSPLCLSPSVALSLTLCLLAGDGAVSAMSAAGRRDRQCCTWRAENRFVFFCVGTAISSSVSLSVFLSLSVRVSLSPLSLRRSVFVSLFQGRDAFSPCHHLPPLTSGPEPHYFRLPPPLSPASYFSLSLILCDPHLLRLCSKPRV